MMMEMMVDLETLIYHGDIEGKVIASDLDGTLLSGDLGETLFMLTLVMQGLGWDIPRLPDLLQRIRTQNEIRCPAAETAGILERYFAFLLRGDLVPAYSLTMDYLAGFTPAEISTASETILAAGLPQRQLRLSIGERSFVLPIQAQPDSLMTHLIQDGYARGARVYIVSGSPQGVVESFCRFIGLPESLARGATFDAQGKAMIPYGKAKLDLLAGDGAGHPFIAVGNSIGDFEMLNAAIHPFVRKSSTQVVLDKARTNQWRLV